MNKNGYLLILGMMIISSTPSWAQFQSVPADFLIKKIINNNNTNTLKMRLNMQVETSDGLLDAIAVLSMCNCYCDSIWDAWPTEIGAPGIEGTGTLHYSNNGGQGAPGLPQNGVLGIRMVDGGIDRETDFNVWVKFLWVE